MKLCQVMCWSNLPPKFRPFYFGWLFRAESDKPWLQCSLVVSTQPLLLIKQIFSWDKLVCLSSGFNKIMGRRCHTCWCVLHIYLCKIGFWEVITRLCLRDMSL